MGAEKDRTRTVSRNYTSVKDTIGDVGKRKTEKLKKTPNALVVPPRDMKELSELKSPSTTMTFSPVEMNDYNDVAVAAAADVAAKRFVRKQRQWKLTVKAFSSFLSKVPPASTLKKARDCYVRSLGNFATHLNSSTACGATYGAGHNSLPSAWRSTSERFRDQDVESDGYLSATFKQSLIETHMSRSSRSLGSIPPAAGSRYYRVSSARKRLHSTSKCSTLPMQIYTIKETS